MGLFPGLTPGQTERRGMLMRGDANHHQNRQLISSGWSLFTVINTVGAKYR